MEKRTAPETEMAMVEPQSNLGSTVLNDAMRTEQARQMGAPEAERSEGRNGSTARQSAASMTEDITSSRVSAESLVSDPGALRLSWDSIQVGFVDDPRRAVGDAERLVSSVVEELVDGFRLQRQRLEAYWSEGADASTDDLRRAFQRYRDFFERLLQI